MENKKYTCNDMPKLYICPFCGSENITIRYGASGYSSNVYYPNETGFVTCLNCGARSLKTRYAKNAVKKWNTRKEPKASAPKWISVEERLPETDERVMFVDDGEVGFGIVRGWALKEMIAETDIHRITHWMPLPKPPEEVERCLNEKQ